MQTTVELPHLRPGPIQGPGEPPRRWPRLRRRVREGIVAGALVIGFMLPFLASPHPGAKARQRCLNPVNLGGRLHVDLSCDSAVFLYLAQDPSRVLGQFRTWQSRPLFGVLGWGLSQPFRAMGLESVGRRLPASAWAPGRGGAPEGRMLPYYAGFIVLNTLLLAATLMLFRRVMGARSYREPVILLPAAVLLANEVTRAYFWTPHVQMFNVFIPVLSLWLFCWLPPRLGTMGWMHAAAIGAALGVGALAYGGFAVPAAGAALLLLARGAPPAQRVARAASLLAAFALPLAAWTAFVVARTGSFYSHEVARYRQFAWMADAAEQGPRAFATALAGNLAEYAQVLGRVALFPALVLTALALAMHRAGDARRPAEGQRPIATAVLVYLLVSIPFFALLGFYATRLAWTVVPALLVVIALETDALRQALGPRRRLVTIVAALLALCHTAYWVASPYP